MPGDTLEYYHRWGVVHPLSEPKIVALHIYEDRKKLDAEGQPDEIVRLETDFLGECGISGEGTVCRVLTVIRTTGNFGDIKMLYFQENDTRVDKVLSDLEEYGCSLMKIDLGYKVI